MSETSETHIAEEQGHILKLSTALKGNFTVEIQLASKWTDSVDAYASQRPARERERVEEGLRFRHSFQGIKMSNELF